MCTLVIVFFNYFSIEKILENGNNNADRLGNFRYVKVFQTIIQRAFFDGLLNNRSFENLRKIPWRHELWDVGCTVAVLQESLIFIKVAIERPSVKIVVLKIFMKANCLKSRQYTLKNNIFDKYMWSSLL